MKFLAAAEVFSLVTTALCAPRIMDVDTRIDIPSMDAPTTIDDRALKVQVKIPDGTIIGSSLLDVEHFNGIPYADAPVGQLRLRPPQKLSRNLGTFDARGIAPACPQLLISNDSKNLLLKLGAALLRIPFVQDLTGREDCLTVDVQRPAGTKAGDKLPVFFWIFGGGFELGSTSTYDATSLLTTAVQQNQPFIFVAVNYRVGGFGFMPGSEILKDGSANLGHLDQRMALQWVADNVEAFGGDPSKVTLWGESAGAISIFNQMALYGGDANYKGKPLFRGAIMNSGGTIPADPVDCPKGQAVYDTVVQKAGCAGQNDTLNCLRGLDYHDFLNAANSVPGILSYNSVATAYLPRPDGKVLPDSPEILAKTGRIHAVPFIIGDQEDEGTLFSLFQTNITTTDKLVSYLSDVFFHNASKKDLRALVDTYSPSVTEGSPFRTGILNDFYPGFKRLAAILGDLTFTLNRRGFLAITQEAFPDLPTWSYLASYDYLTPVLGTFHASDILQTFYGILPNYASASTRTYYFNFLYNLDPNKGVTKFDNWPRWSKNQDLMWFKSALGNDILKDDFRQESADFITSHIDVLRI